MTPGAARDRLLAGCYRSEDPEDVTGLLNSALNQVIAADVLLARLRKAGKTGEIQGDGQEDLITAALANGTLSEAEAEQLRSAIAARAAVIKVDDFSAQEMNPQHDTSVPLET